MSHPLLVLTTVPDEETGLRIAREAVSRKLCACVNLLPRMYSVYEWQGEMRCEPEQLLLIKTTADRYAQLESWLRSVHPYELPEIIAAPIERGLPEYLQWIASGTQT